MISERTSVVYEFGPFRLEVGEHRLVREGQSIPLTGKAFDTLCVLVERHGKLVSKQDLMSAVWPETTVEENNLDRNISTLRKALGEQANGQSFIETVPRVGYRFVAPVTESDSKESLAEESGQEPPSRQEVRFCMTPDKVRLAYARVGCGFPLVRVANCFNHLGFEWESPIWRHWVRDLAKGHSILRYDGRVNGLSDWDVADISFESWVRDLETVVDAAGLNKFALFGHSQGGAIAIAYALRHPERVQALILISSAAPTVRKPITLPPKPVIQFVFSSDFLMWLITTHLQSVMRPAVGVPNGYQLSDSEQAIVSNVIRSVLPIRPRTAGFMFDMFISNTDMDRHPEEYSVEKIQVPTLIIHALDDPLAKYENAAALAARIPNVELFSVRSGGHLLLRSEAAVREEIARFLQALEE